MDGFSIANDTRICIPASNDLYSTLFIFQDIRFIPGNFHSPRKYQIKFIETHRNIYQFFPDYNVYLYCRQAINTANDRWDYTVYF